MRGCSHMAGSIGGPSVVTWVSLGGGGGPGGSTSGISNLTFLNALARRGGCYCSAEGRGWNCFRDSFQLVQ